MKVSNLTYLNSKLKSEHGQWNGDQIIDYDRDKIPWLGYEMPTQHAEHWCDKLVKLRKIKTCSVLLSVLFFLNPLKKENILQSGKKNKSGKGGKFDFDYHCCVFDHLPEDGCLDIDSILFGLFFFSFPKRAFCPDFVRIRLRNTIQFVIVISYII